MTLGYESSFCPCRTASKFAMRNGPGPEVDGLDMINENGSGNKCGSNPQDCSVTRLSPKTC
jgi:hypothetical protein